MKKVPDTFNSPAKKDSAPRRTRGPRRKPGPQIMSLRAKRGNLQIPADFLPKSDNRPASGRPLSCHLSPVTYRCGSAARPPCEEREATGEACWSFGMARKEVSGSWSSRRFSQPPTRRKARSASPQLVHLWSIPLTLARRCATVLASMSCWK
jgi:hypothetical protein